MNINPQNQRIRHAMVFQNKDQEADFYKAWQSYLHDMYTNQNPDNLSKDEICNMYWMRFQLSHWCWDNHVYLPEIKPEPPRRPWRLSTSCENGTKYEVYDNESQTWITVKSKRG